MCSTVVFPTRVMFMAVERFRRIPIRIGCDVVSTPPHPSRKNGTIERLPTFNLDHERENTTAATILLGLVGSIEFLVQDVCHVRFVVRKNEN